MKLIKIINGTYGYHAPGSKSIEPKNAYDLPFEVADAKAERLVKRGVAKYVDKTPAAKSAGVAGPGSKAAGKGGENELPPYNDKMKLQVLKDIAVKYGVPKKVVSSLRSKTDVIKKIDEKRAADAARAAAESEESEEDETGEDGDEDENAADDGAFDDGESDDGDDPPNLNAEDPQP